MSASSLASDAARQHLRLHLVEGLGPILTARLIEHFKDIDAVLAAAPAQLKYVEGIGEIRAGRIGWAPADAVERELELAAAGGVRILCIADDEYPKSLLATPDPPVCLYVRGAFEPEDALALAIVGTRRCSTYGREQAERLGAQAGEVGFTVVSGMAVGIDTAAHRGALLAKGRTIAALGCGLGHVYPRRNEELAELIARNGAVISEYPMQVVPIDQNFPRRNRILAGLSLGVIVVEASDRSGALITARMASEYNREVFAVPGRIDTAYARGCHRLIRDGAAMLVTDLQDVLDALGDVGRALALPTVPGETNVDDSPNPNQAVPQPSAPLENHERRLLDAMPNEPVSIEGLTDRCAFGPARVAATLTSLQLKGCVRRQPGDFYVRVRAE
ncbi:MAG: DNA-processing protein DprA [Phycisphaerae bacterium]